MRKPPPIRITIPPAVNDERRGHAFYPPANELIRIPAIGTVSGHTDDDLVYLHYDNGGTIDLLVAELDHRTGYCFAWIHHNWGAEPGAMWAEFDLPWFEAHLGVPRSGMWRRDLAFTPIPAKDAMKAIRDRYPKTPT